MIVAPGDSIVAVAGYVRGHGTYEEDGELVANVPGVVERVNKLVRVRPLQARFTGEVGDIVVGRIKDVGSKRWKVDVRGRQDAVLHLSMVNMPGGAQRRRTFEDQLNMRSLFKENDLISAEVHQVHTDGSLSIHARSLKYGKLENGQLLVVGPGLVRRVKHHFVSLPSCGVDVIFGLNGYIWLTESLQESAGNAESLSKLSIGADGNMLDAADAADAENGLAEAIEKMKRFAADRIIDAGGRNRISRVANAITVLSNASLPIVPESIVLLYKESISLKLEAKDMLHPTNAAPLIASM